MTTYVGWAPIVKAEKQADGTLVVTGRAADSSVDRDHQIADPAWLDKALGQWYGEPDGGNIREQHDGRRAVGRAIEYRKGGDGGHYITAHVVDPVSVLKVENRVLRGFSWSARNGRIQVDKAAAGGRIVDGQIYEVSLVDRPANPNCLFTIAKADDSGDLVDVEDPELVEREPSFTPSDLRKVLDHLKMPAPDEMPMFGDDLHKFVSADQRREYADKGIAMPSGDFPIPDKGHLKSAIGRLANYTGDKAAARKHIIKRARALGATDMLPDEWGVSKADGVVAEWGPLIAKADGEGDVQDASDGQAAVAAIARLIVSEAESLAAGNMNELCDIQMLVDAACALRCFVTAESMEDEMAETAKADGGGGQSGDTTTTTTGQELDKTVTDSDTDGLTVLVQKAVTEATKPLTDELALVKAELAQVKATPVPGGPARVRSTGHSAVAEKADGIRRTIDELQVEVGRTQDVFLRKGYQERLSAAQAELEKLDG